MTIRNYVTDSALNPSTLVCFSTTDMHVTAATGPTSELIGVSDELPHNAGDRVDVIRSGPTLVQYGGTVNRGDWLTANATGQAVTAAPAAGTNNPVIGRAEVAGVAGDIVEIILAVGQIQG